MILTKKDFDTIGSEGMVAQAGLIYKLLLQCNYEIVNSDTNPLIKHLVLKTNIVDSIDIIDINNYLSLHHTTYKLINKRIEVLKTSNKLNKKDLIMECYDILKQIVEIYTAKYFYNRLKPDTIQNQLKTIRI